MMKALSLWEPYGSLIALEAKRFETRSWPTTYRGDLLICTSKKGFSNRNLDRLLQNPQFQEALSPLRPHFPAQITRDDLTFGRALCIARLEECLRIVSTSEITMDPSFRICDVPKEERYFGYFIVDRFAFRLTNIRRFKEPWPVTGRQRLFDVPDEEIAKHELEAV
jgi:ASCH domain